MTSQPHSRGALRPTIVLATLTLFALMSSVAGTENATAIVDNARPMRPTTTPSTSPSSSLPSTASSTTTTSTSASPPPLALPLLLHRREDADAPESFYDSVGRILRNTNTASFRGQSEQRWRRIGVGRDTLERRHSLFKRDVVVVAAATVAGDTTSSSSIASGIATGDADAGTYSILNLSCHQLHSFRNTFDTAISVVDLSCNGLQNGGSITKTLTLAHLPALRTLSLAGNEIGDFAGATLFGGGVGRTLRSLDLSANRLRALNGSHFAAALAPAVERIRLANNEIERIAPGTFRTLSGLQVLDLSYNRLDGRAVPELQAIGGLVALSVAFNRRLGVALPDFVASWSLKELDASGTDLCGVPAALAQSVHALNVSHNRFEIIRRGDMDSYPLLKYLDLSHNRIADIEDDAFGRLEILITLQLHHNLLTTMPTNLPGSLAHLLLADNRITDIAAATFAQLENLRTLDLSGNRLTYVPALPLARLTVLNLRASGLRGLEAAVVQSSPLLREIQLDGNPIKCTDLMSIAEWTTTCRTETPSNAPGLDGDQHEREQPAMREGLLEPAERQASCCGKPLQRRGSSSRSDASDVLPECKRDVLPTTTTTTMSLVSTTQPAATTTPRAGLKQKSRKAKMEDIWRALSSESTTTVAGVTADTTTIPPKRRNGKSLIIPSAAAVQTADVRHAKLLRTPPTTAPATTTSITTTTPASTAATSTTSTSSTVMTTLLDKKKITFAGKKSKPKTTKSALYSVVKADATSMPRTTTLATTTSPPTAAAAAAAAADGGRIEDTNIYVAEQSLTAEIALDANDAAAAAVVVFGRGTDEDNAKRTAAATTATTTKPRPAQETTTNAPPNAEADPAEPAAQPLAVNSNRSVASMPAATAVDAAVAASTSAQQKLTSTGQRGGGANDGSGPHAGVLVLGGIFVGMSVSMLVVHVYRCAARRSMKQRARRFDGCEDMMDGMNASTALGHRSDGAGAGAGAGGRWRRRECTAHDDIDDNADDETADTPSASDGNYRDMLPMELLGAAAAAATSTIPYSEAPIELW